VGEFGLAIRGTVTASIANTQALRINTMAGIRPLKMKTIPTKNQGARRLLEREKRIGI
jgi:hypothetical protein